MLDNNSETIDERNSGSNALNDMIDYLNIPESTNREEDHQSVLSQVITNPTNALRQQVQLSGKSVWKSSVLFYLSVDKSIHCSTAQENGETELFNNQVSWRILMAIPLHIGDI